MSFCPLLKKVDLIIINDEEAEQLTGEKNIFNSGQKMLKMGPTKVIIKKGEHGAIYLDGNNKFILPAYPVTNLVDPTGAGDSFAGGIAGLLSSKKKIGFEEIKEAMIYGTLTASFCVESFGVEGLKKLDKETLNNRLENFQIIFDIVFITISLFCFLNNERPLKSRMRISLN